MRQPDLTAEELLKEYEEGRRDFSHLMLDGIHLPSITLKEVAFEESSLQGANLSRSRLGGADFMEADLSGANLQEVILVEGALQGATLKGADLRGASLGGTSFSGADFTGADMRAATLDSAHFEGTILTAARFDEAVLWHTHFFDVDIGPLCDASSLIHEGPSSIDARTVMRSYKHPRLKSFMVDCGIPEVFAEYMIECAKALGDDLLQELMQSTFISYGGPDEPFARRLYDALRANGVVTFFFPETARVGERIGDEVFNALQRHDRMILVCSRASLDRPGVLNEVQETLDREARDGGATYLIPIMLDDYLLTDWKEVQPELAERVGRRVAADFSGTASYPAKFDAALSRLLAALRKKGPGYTSPV